MALPSVTIALCTILLAACGEVSRSGESDGDGASDDGGAPDDGAADDDGGDEGGDELSLIDDVEDGDRDIPAVDGREGWWFILEDSSGGEVMPPPDAFLPTEGGASDSAYCAGMSGAGQTDWGVHLGLYLSRASGDPPQPYDASSHGGVVFQARGNVSIRASLSMPATRPVEQLGGTCKPTPELPCGDFHGLAIDLTPDWQEYRLPLAEIEQAGWGLPVPFDAATVTTVQFEVPGDGLEFDICVDDVRFD